MYFPIQLWGNFFSPSRGRRMIGNGACTSFPILFLSRLYICTYVRVLKTFFNWLNTLSFMRLFWNWFTLCRYPVLSRSPYSFFSFSYMLQICADTSSSAELQREWKPPVSETVRSVTETSAALYLHCIVATGVAFCNDVLLRSSQSYLKFWRRAILVKPDRKWFLAAAAATTATNFIHVMSVFVRDGKFNYFFFLCFCPPNRLQAWRAEGLPLSTTSNEACKLYDAIITQVGQVT